MSQARPVVAKIALGVVAALALVTLTAAGCGAAPTPEVIVVEKIVERPAMAPAADEEMVGQSSGLYGASEAPALEKSAEERMIIRTADLSLRVEDTETAVEEVKSIVAALDGYVANSNVYRVGEKLRGNITVRVPAKSFDKAMAQLKDVAVSVERESISGQDVTEEYSDLGAQLRNLEATETELLELLTTVRQRSNKAEDILAVHRELTRIREQIERLQGRRQYLERMTALATINVELIPKEAIVRRTWTPTGTAEDAVRSLIRAGQFLVDAAIWVMIFFLPVIIVLAVPFVVLFIILRQWRRRRRQTAQS